MTQTDLIIIGAGPGGYKAAVYAAKHGLKVTIFEDANVGGTCLNVGCIPTKTYVHSATFAEAIERQQKVVEALRSGVETLLSHPNITLVREKGVFIDAHTVNGYTAPNIIVATGSSPKMLPIEGADSPRVVTSTGLLQLTTLPRKLCIIGAGVIGMEFASVFNRFGSEVTVIEYLKECLPMLDSDCAKRLRKLLERQRVGDGTSGMRPRVGDGTSGMRPRVGDGTSGMKRGITFHMKTAVNSLNDIDADVILMATGRKPNVSPDLQNVGIVFDERKGIQVDDHFETTVKGVYAIGDVNGRQMLAHAAEAQAKLVIEHITSQNGTGADSSSFTPHFPLPIPAAIFTEPEAACVGPAEDQLKTDGTPYECRKAFWRSNGKAMAMNETEGMLKLFSEPDAGRILGCHAYGAHAADLVQEASVLMCMGATVVQLRQMVHIHPTLSELLLAAAEQ